jgi:methyl-accepting chemotaxis protein
MDLSFSIVILQHQIWKIKLRSLLDNQERLTLEEAGSHKSCQLGEWLYTTGMEKYGKDADMIELEEVHADFHNEVRRVVELKNQGKTQEAEIEYQKVLPLSTKVIDLLEKLESKIN